MTNCGSACEEFEALETRIAELEAELVDVVRLRAVERERNRGVTDGLQQELALLREDVAVWRALRDALVAAGLIEKEEAK